MTPVPYKLPTPVLETYMTETSQHAPFKFHFITITPIIFTITLFIANPACFLLMVWYTALLETEKMLWPPYGHGLFLFGFISTKAWSFAMVIILFRGNLLKYFSDLNACLLMCFVSVNRKAGIVLGFLVYIVMESRISFSTSLSGIFMFRKKKESTFSGTRVSVLAINLSANFIKFLIPFHCIPKRRVLRLSSVTPYGARKLETCTNLLSPGFWFLLNNANNIRHTGTAEPTTQTYTFMFARDQCTPNVFPRMIDGISVRPPSQSSSQRFHQTWFP